MNHNRIIYQLDIIASIRVGDRLMNDNNGYLLVDNREFLQLIRRRLNSDDKNSTIAKLDEFINTTIEHSNIYIRFIEDYNKLHQDEKTGETLKKHYNDIREINKLADAQTNAYQGIENLAGTYNNDKPICIKINAILVKLKQSSHELSMILKQETTLNN